jgi:hypothetical protein
MPTRERLPVDHGAHSMVWMGGSSPAGMEMPAPTLHVAEPQEAPAAGSHDGSGMSIEHDRQRRSEVEAKATPRS